MKYLCCTLIRKIIHYKGNIHLHTEDSDNDSDYDVTSHKNGKSNVEFDGLIIILFPK